MDSVKDGHAAIALSVLVSRYITHVYGCMGERKLVPYIVGGYHNYGENYGPHQFHLPKDVTPEIGQQLIKLGYPQEGDRTFYQLDNLSSPVYVGHNVEDFRAALALQGIAARFVNRALDLIEGPQG